MSAAQAAWTITADEYPYNLPLPDRLRFLLGYAVLAPSSHNTQPWKFELRPDGLDVHADPTRGLPIIDPERRQLVMSCGAALYNLRLALRRFALRASIELFPDEADPAHLARVTVLGGCRPTPRDIALFEAIPRRRTNRQPFDGKPVSWRIAGELAAIVEEEGAWLVRLHPRARTPLAQVIGAADRRQYADRRFRRELSDWLVPLASRRKDGIPFIKKEYGRALPFGVTMLVRTFDLGAELAAKEEQLLRGSPMMVVLGTDDDTCESWLAAGQAMQAMLLTACTYGLSASFLNQALELDDLRSTVANLTEREGHPQLILRLGFGPPVLRPTPRRPVDAVTK